MCALTVARDSKHTQESWSRGSVALFAASTRDGEDRAMQDVAEPHQDATQEPDPRPEDEGLRFDDPAWDDEYCTWLDNGLRTCCG